MLDEKKLWLQISGSITFYLKTYDSEKSNEELLKDYLYYTLNEEDGTYQYLDKQTFKYVYVSTELLEKAKKVFMERLEKRRLKEPEPKALITNNVVSFTNYKNKK